MPRKLRLEYPGAMYHVMSRGDQREDIFLDDVDRHDFIKTLAEACESRNNNHKPKVQWFDGVAAHTLRPIITLSYF